MTRRSTDRAHATGRIAGVAALCAAAVLLVPTLRVEASPRVVQEVDEPPTYSAGEAADHVGERAIVCGKVASAAFVPGVRGRPTFLNLGKPYPDQLFTVVIWGRHRAKFGEPEKRYADQEICVSGTIEEFEGTPQMEAREAEQIRACETLC